MKLVLLPGLDGTGILFKPLIDTLPKSIDISVISYPNDEKMNYEQLIKLVLSKLPKEEEYILLAESFSGSIAYEVGIQSPKNLKLIIFVATFLKNPRPILSKFLPINFFNILFSFSPPKFILKWLLLSNKTNDETINLLAVTLKKIPPKIITWRLQQIIKLKEPMNKLVLDAIYISATTDKSVIYQSICFMIKWIPKLKTYRVHGGHLILQDNPSDCAKIIIKHLS